MHDALGMDVRDCSLPIRQRLGRLQADFLYRKYVRKKGEPPGKRRFDIWETLHSPVDLESLHFQTQQSSESSAMSIMYCVHSRDQTDLYISMALWRLTYLWDMQKIGEFGSCKPRLLKLFHCTSMFHPQVRFFPHNLENFFSSLMT